VQLLELKNSVLELLHERLDALHKAPHGLEQLLIVPDL
jgi:hypothetical protein